MTTRNMGLVACMMIAAVALAGCISDPGKATTAMKPKTPVVKTMTNFNQAKSCMDQLLLDGSRRGLPITSEKIDDATGTVKVSTVDMVINAISEMSKRSGAFNYLQMEGTTSSVTRLQSIFSPIQSVSPAQIPSVYIRGSISQADNNITRDDASGGVTLPWVSLGLSKDQSVDTISVDLQMVNLLSRTVMPGITTSNTITVVSEGDSTTSRGLIRNGAFGAALSVSLASSQREGRGQAVRTLLEYSLIELLGKYTNVPYQRCLELPSTDPTSGRTAQERYDALTPELRTRAIQAALASSREYQGPVDGRMSASFQSAVTAAKLKRNLVPNGRIDFQLFDTLHDENILPEQVFASVPVNPAVVPPRPPGPTPATGNDPFGLNLALTKPVLRHGDRVNVRASVTSPAHLYCYYEYRDQGTLQVARIFPNRFQTDNYVLPERSVLIPRPGDEFEVVLEGRNPESIACVATTIDYTGANRLPFLEEPDLSPIAAEWPGLAYPLYKHQEIDSLQTSVKKLTFQING